MLYFREFGDRKNPTILLLPGAGMAQTFYCQYGFADRFHLVEVHLLGTGEEAAKKWSLRENIDGVLAIIKEIGKEKVSLAGCSMGAQMAVALLCEAPQYFGRAIIISAWLIKDPKQVKKLCRLMKLLFYVENSSYFAKKEAKQMGMDPQTTADFLRQGKNNRRDNYDAYSWDGVDIKKYPQFASVDVPMLALVGEKESRDVMIESTLTLGRMNPNCVCQVWKDHAHDIPYVRPEEFNRVFLDFMQGAPHKAATKAPGA